MKAKRSSKSPEEINAALAAKKGPISKFIAKNYRHFNAAALLDAAKGYETHLAAGGKMLVTLAGAMSTAELGISLAEMIRRKKVDLIVCTGANLEEDIFNLVAHDHYERVPHYRQLTPQDEQRLLSRHMNRVTDTCIPEMEAMRRIEKAVLEEWIAADREGLSFADASEVPSAVAVGQPWTCPTRAFEPDSRLVAVRNEPFRVAESGGWTR